MLLTFDQLAAYAQKAGFTGDDVNTAAAIAISESSGNPAAVGDLTLPPPPSVGLWQIYLNKHPEYTEAQLKDPQANANAAFAIFKEAGGSFMPWTTYKNRAYLTHLPPGTQPGTQPLQGRTAPQLVQVSAISSEQTPTANGYVYGYTGPPFNFLGHFCKTQFDAFTSWVNARTSRFPAIQQHYQIRAAQLRKTAGALERYYATLNDEVLKPTFKKEPWKPGPQGHFNYPYRDDQLPMVAMGQIKDYMKDQFQRQDEAVFQMNHLRNVIEKTEDKAEKSFLAANSTQWSNETVPSLITRLNGYFGVPAYEAVLVNDQKNVYPKETTKPRFRVHQLDIPTQYEIEQATSAPAGTGPSVNTKEIGT